MSARLLFATACLLFCVTEASALSWQDAGYDADWNDSDITPYTGGGAPENARCNPSTKDFIAVCWLNNPQPVVSGRPDFCAYKSIRVGSNRYNSPDGGGPPGRVWLCQ
jgi:hypothetical protein